MRIAVVAALLVSSLMYGTPAKAAGTVTEVVVNQAGFSAGAHKSAHVLATGVLTDTTYQILNGATVIASGSLVDRGSTWGARVYDLDFSTVTQTGTAFTVRSNGVSSYPFRISANIWDSYKDEMTAFYRLQRANVATSAGYPTGYSSVAPSAKVFHAAGHLDDAASADGTQHHDLTGGWYDAGDYGKFAGNQWVTGEIALAYVRHADSPNVQYDNDANGVPDLLDEARVGSSYLIKSANQFGGALYDLANDSGFQHPEFATDNVVGTADDRRIRNLSVGGSAKAAGSLAATARAIEAAIAGGNIAPAAVAELTSFAAACETAAVTFYTYAAANPAGPVGSYPALGGIPNSMLWAEVQLYLLTGTTSYATAATSKINGLTFADLRSTNYWDQRPISMAEFYPVANAATQTQIRTLLRQQVEYFLSSSDDTPYGVLDVFSGFGVNEPHMSYVGDLIRYYELFGDPIALRGALRGVNWIFGDNPWNLSWVSGIGADHVDFLHTRLDEQSYDHANTGIVIPGALVSGPNIKSPTDANSVSPWYEDRPLWQDDIQQWRYNEYSISIQAGLLYTVMALSDLNDASSSGGVLPFKLPVTTPLIGDVVTGDVTVLVQPGSALSAVELGTTPMTLQNGIWSGSVNVDSFAPYANRQLNVRGTQSAGKYTYSTTHVQVAPPLPDPAHPLLYDNFSKGGTFGSTAFGWVNWFNQSGGTGTYAAAVVDGRDIGKFTQTPSSASSLAKFEPWHDYGDFAGFRYLSLTMKNPGYPNARYRVSIGDGTDNCSLTNGVSVPVATNWTEYRYDLNLCPLVDKSHVHLSLWLQQTGGTYGELLIDEIKTTVDATGTAPTLTAGAVSPASGTSTTPFTFSVTYTDVDNQAPHVVDVVVDGVVHHLTGTNPADVTYTDGKTYAYTTLLAKGNHSYYFRTTDTTSNAVRTSTQSGPTN
ncbi:glycoside hydrolase family 9 protein [Tenggerimyces flavus]|uniref:Glycoside hydrolase family 9 protein n=1 Tax=Tenggerimyces flavus TaxID=1708749 RepID=A0ABV7YKM5_9ACTN|nr:glycoside hydrolase family 9 protein [Tenggerimyces flavus]MBM7787406.1 hypothetical protein [Tenggerimyces flavus]